MIVRDVMTKTVHVCTAMAPLSEAARILWDQDCGVVPVVDAGGHPIGMVTDRDVCMAAYTQGARLAELPVHSAMATQLFCVRDDEPVRAAVATMHARGVRRLPVLDSDDRLVGLLSIGDCIRKRVAGPDELLECMAKLCAPRHEHDDGGDSDGEQTVLVPRVAEMPAAGEHGAGRREPEVVVANAAAASVSKSAARKSVQKAAASKATRDKKPAAKKVAKKKASASKSTGARKK